MGKNGNGHETALKQLSPPARNHYFYGKLLDVVHFQMEQTYFNRKRWLLNRLGLGSGVLCGLEVEVADDGQKIWLRPGVAIDGLGREIIVPSAYCLENPRQPTDGQGRADGDPIEGAGAVTLCLAYHECETEPVPVMVGDCDTKDGCAPSTIRERYRLLVRAGQPEDRVGALAAEQCQTIFPRGELSTDFDHHEAACETLSGSCSAPDSTCVVLATVQLPASEDAALHLDACTYRTTVYSNGMLWELMTCLAERVDACCQTRQLRYVSGDAQTGPPGDLLEEPLVAEVINGAGEPVAGVAVRFRVRGGGGGVEPESVESDENGRVAARFKLGPNPGLHTAEATLAGGAHTAYHALAAGEGEPPVEPPTETAPVILGMAPPYAADIMADDALTEFWLEQPRLGLRFDRQMNQAQLEKADLLAQWLRVWQVTESGETEVRRLQPELIDTQEARDGFRVTYGLEVPEPEARARYLIQIRAEEGNIVDLNRPALLLDAEFSGTRLSARQLKAIWEIEDVQFFGDATVWEALVNTRATLPQSGDGSQGGHFHAWFEFSGER